MDQSAVVYFVNSKIIVASVVRTTAGVGLEVDPVLSSPQADELIPIVLRALERSAIVVEHPAQNEWNGFFQPFLNAASVRSYKAFMADAKQVSIELIGDQLKIVPERNRGATKGFDPMPDDAILVPVVNASEAASALVRLLG